MTDVDFLIKRIHNLLIKKQSVIDYQLRFLVLLRP